MSTKRIIDLENSNQLGLNDYLAVYNSEPVADHFTFKRTIGDILNLISLSINGKTGSTITLNADDISDTITAKKFVTSSEKAKLNLIRNDLEGNVFLAGDGTYRTIGTYSGATTVLVVTGNTSLNSSSHLLVICDSTNEQINIDLPASPANKQSVRFKDGGGHALTNNIIVNGNGKAIEHPSEAQAFLNSNYGAFEMMFIQPLNKWIIISFLF